MRPRSKLTSRKIQMGLVIPGAIAVTAALWQSFSVPETHTGSIRVPGKVTFSLATEGDVYQSGKIVGTAIGAKVVSGDGSKLEFSEIANARELNYSKEFSFSGRRLKIVQVRQVQYSQAGSATTLVRVVAEIVPDRE